ncbi:MAG: DUF3078 domain-containing protein [Bacteroidetes bacterium]|nr:DUF3078 domain-containing protein [Bacteroidota bacterium]
MKKILISACLCSSFALVQAQDGTVSDLKKEANKTIKKDANDTIPKTWKTGGTFTLNINQGSLSNWSAGGDKFSFSLNSYLNLYAFYKKGKNNWDNSLDLSYGFVNTTSLGNRKASDRIDLLSKYGYDISKHLSVGALLNFRSQFANGYAYSKTAAGKDTATLTSKSFAPAYLLLSLGLDYKPVKDLSIFISPITGRWIFVGDTLLGPGYGLDPGKKVKSEIGAFLSANYMKKIGTSFTFKTRFDLFSNYKHDPQNIDVYWSNVLTAKITKFINFSLNVDMIYDNDTKNVDPSKGPAPQWLELMGIGFSYTFRK